MKKTEKTLDDARKGLHNALAESHFYVDKFGDQLAKRGKVPAGLDGDEAVRFYLMQKHNWLPRDVLAMPYSELRFALLAEMKP